MCGGCERESFDGSGRGGLYVMLHYFLVVARRLSDTTHAHCSDLTNSHSSTSLFPTTKSTHNKSPIRGIMLV